MYYTPYGEKVKSAISGPDIFNKKYTGQIDDGDDSGLLYYNARYYDPMLGRFISPDTVIPKLTFSQSFNRYMYVLGNPINYNDPGGKSPHSDSVTGDDSGGYNIDNSIGNPSGVDTESGKTDPGTESDGTGTEGPSKTNDYDRGDSPSTSHGSRGHGIDKGMTTAEQMINDARLFNQYRDATDSILSNEIANAIMILNGVNLDSALIQKNSCAVNSLFIELRRIGANVEGSWSEFYTNNVASGLINPKTAKISIQKVAEKYKVGTSNVMYNLITNFSGYNSFQGEGGVVHFKTSTSQHFMNSYNDSGNKLAIDASWRSLNGINSVQKYMDESNFISFYYLSIK